MTSTAPESIAPSEPTGTEPSTAVTTPDPTPAAPADPAPQDNNVWDNPETAKAEIERLRRENAKDRTNAKAQAADEARNELAQTIGKALGIVADNTPVDPTALTEQLTTSQADAKQARVELAVFRNAAAAGGDPAALLDSTSFLRSLADIDPADSAAVQAAIVSAVEANSRLGAATEPRTPAPNPAQGASANGAGPAQLTEADVKRMAAEGDHAGIEKARIEGRLNTLLGIK